MVMTKLWSSSRKDMSEVVVTTCRYICFEVEDVYVGNWVALLSIYNAFIRQPLNIWFKSR